MSGIESFHQGDDVNFDVTVYSDAAKTVLKDLTGATIVGRIGTVGATPATSVEMAGSVIDGPNGSARAPLAASESGDLDAGLYNFQMEVTDSAGKVNIVTDSKVRCKPALPDA